MISGQMRMAFFSIALPALSPLQNDQKRFCGFYYKFLNMVSWATIPLAVFCFVFADEIIYIYFGSQWQASAFYMKILSVKALVLPMVTSLDQVPLALGFSRRYMYAGMVRSFSAIFCVALGVFVYDITGAAIGMAISDIVIFIPFFMICSRNSGVNLLNYLKTIFAPLLVSLLVGILLYFLKKPLDDQSVIHALIPMLSYFGIVFLCFCVSDYFVIGSRMNLVNSALKLIREKRKK